MSTSYEKHLNELILHSTYSMGEDWLVEMIQKGFSEFDTETITDYAQSDSATIYELSLLIKAGFKGIDSEKLLSYLDSDDEDEQYDAAISLAIYGDPLGFETLKKIIEAYPNSHTLVPEIDILPDLKYLNPDEAQALEKYIRDASPHPSQDSSK